MYFLMQQATVLSADRVSERGPHTLGPPVTRQRTPLAQWVARPSLFSRLIPDRIRRTDKRVLHDPGQLSIPSPDLSATRNSNSHSPHLAETDLHRVADFLKRDVPVIRCGGFWSDLKIVVHPALPRHGMQGYTKYVNDPDTRTHASAVAIFGISRALFTSLLDRTVHYP